jgi:hypothetical protein
MERERAIFRSIKERHTHTHTRMCVVIKRQKYFGEKKSSERAKERRRRRRRRKLVIKQPAKRNIEGDVDWN